ncbi:MAG TPA: site-specific DNA-methyltransferase [Gemmatimonadaceae bacterium]
MRQVVPEAFADGRVDWDVLREALGDWLESDEAEAEHFGLTWPGKREARRLAAMPSRGTLVPAPGEGIDEETTSNLFIEGDNLEVLKLLQKSYAGRVKMIYIDPPYNTGNDFVYKDDFAEPLAEYFRRTGQTDEAGNARTTNTRSDGRFHSNWLSMMYPRLRIAWSMLRLDGFLVVSIDDVEAAHLRVLLNEVFGEENYLATLVYDRNRKNDARFFSIGHEYMHVYARDKSFLSANETILRAPKEGVDDVRTEWQRLRKLNQDDWGHVRDGLKAFFARMPKDDPRKPLSRFAKVDEKGPYRDDGNINWPGGGGPRYAVLHPTTSRPVRVPRSGWRYPTPERMREMINAGVVVFGPDETTVPGIRTNLFDKSDQVLRSVHYSYAQTAANEFDQLFGGHRVFDNPKPVADLLALVQYLSEDDDIVLDFFSGSATTGQAVISANQQFGGRRKFIMVQLPEAITDAGSTSANARRLGLETISDIGKERLRRAIKKLRRTGNSVPNDDVGFRVYKLRRSNFRAWQDYDGTDVNELESLFAQAETPLVSGWAATSLLPEVMLLEGFPLDATVAEKRPERKQRVFVVESVYVAHRLLACFDDRLDDKALARLELREDDVFVCLDTALTDRVKMRLADRCTLRTI